MTIKFRLSNMEMDEVSFVAAGDNPPARICLFKSVGTSDVDELSEEVEETHIDDESLFVKTTSGKIYQADEFSYDNETDEFEVGDLVLLVDPDDEDADVPTMDITHDPGIIKAITTSIAEGLSSWFKDEYDISDEDLEKGRFKEAMQARVAEQAYNELSDMTKALKGAIDMGLYSGDDASKLKESVSEFAESLNSAIDKWTSGQPSGAEVVKEHLDHAMARDQEVLASSIDEEDADVVRETVEKSEGQDQGQGEGEEREEIVAGIDRSKLSDEEIQQLDEQEAELERLRAQSAAGKGGVQVSGGLAQPAGESYVPGPGDQAAGNYPTNPEDVVGDTGAHTAPWAQVEKMLKEMPDGPQKQVMEFFMKQNRELLENNERQTYVNKARGIEGVNPEEFGPVLQRIEKGRSTSDDARYVMDVMRSRQAVEKHGEVILNQLSSFEKGGTGAGGGARAQLMAKAAEVQRTQGVSPEVAIGIVREDPQNADLVEAYMEEEVG